MSFGGPSRYFAFSAVICEPFTFILWKHSDRKTLFESINLSSGSFKPLKGYYYFFLFLFFCFFRRSRCGNRSKTSALPAFIYVDAAIDHAHKEIMSLGFSVSRWARTLIRKSIALSIGPAVFGEGLQCEAAAGDDGEATYRAIARQFCNLQVI